MLGFRLGLDGFQFMGLAMGSRSVYGLGQGSGRIGSGFRVRL